MTVVAAEEDPQHALPKAIQVFTPLQTVGLAEEGAINLSSILNQYRTEDPVVSLSERAASRLTVWKFISILLSASGGWPVEIT